MTRLFVFFAFILGFTALAGTAQAEIVSAGEPDVVHVERDPGFVYADIYQRQLSYRETFIALDEDIKERQKNYHKPSHDVKKAYEEDLKALHDSIK